mmetsp:Transcript_73453/g.204030  ORF Transcript_73453/g.204030 Transcript_73453/m.204030 type:complete len:211 (+) Transcript_73453:331-963(+)
MCYAELPHRSAQSRREDAAHACILRLLVVLRSGNLVDFVFVLERVNVAYCPRMATVANTQDANALWHVCVQSSRELVVGDDSLFGQDTLAVRRHEGLIEAVFLVPINIWHVDAMARPEPHEPVAGVATLRHRSDVPQNDRPRGEVRGPDASLVGYDSDVLDVSAARNAEHRLRILGACQLRPRRVLVIQCHDENSDNALRVPERHQLTVM